ncbi:MAG: transketolase C-terminal domain-containing protein [Verrucomicrobiia bacterium]
MRAAFIQTLVELAAQDERILLLTADLGYLAIEPFADRFPDRFFNVGVAEENMLGVATGLADSGFIPFVYSIVPFAVLRPFEFIRNGPIMHRLPVRIVGVGGGFEYGHNGLTHYGVEDVGVMRTQPGIRVVAPADHEQTRTALRRTWNVAGPVYYRIGKDDRTVVTGLGGRFELDEVQTVRPGRDVVIAAMGSIAPEAVAAAEQLRKQGVDAEVIVVASIHPAPERSLLSVLRRFPVCVTVEAHYLSGGLGSLVAEVIAEASVPCRLARCAVRELPIGVTGSQRFMHERSGLDRAAIVRRTLEALKTGGNA